MKNHYLHVLSIMNIDMSAVQSQLAQISTLCTKEEFLTAYGKLEDAYSLMRRSHTYVLFSTRQGDPLRDQSSQMLRDLYKHKQEVWAKLVEQIPAYGKELYELSVQEFCALYAHIGVKAEYFVCWPERLPLEGNNVASVKDAGFQDITSTSQLPEDQQDTFSVVIATFEANVKVVLEFDEGLVLGDFLKLVIDNYEILYEEDDGEIEIFKVIDSTEPITFTR